MPQTLLLATSAGRSARAFEEAHDEQHRGRADRPDPHDGPGASRSAWVGRRSTRAWSPGWGRRGSSTACRSRSPARSPACSPSPTRSDMTSTEVGLIASVYLDRPADRRAGVRADVGPARAQAAVDHHVAAVPARHRAGGVRHRPSHRLAGVLLRHPPDRRDGDRRPVRGDQLGDRRDDAVEVPGTGRHLDQRVVLGRRDPRLVRLAHLPQRLRRERRLAAGVPDGPGAGAGGHRRGPHPAREPAVAADPRPRRGGRGRAGEDRGRAGQAARAGERRSGDRARAGEAVRLPAVPPAGVPHLPEAGDPRRDVDDHPVVPVQRHLLHLRPGAHPVLRRQRDQRAGRTAWRSRSGTCSDRCCSARSSTPSAAGR